MTKKFIISIGSILAIILVGSFVIWPLSLSLFESINQVNKEEGRLRDLQDLIAKTEELTQEYQIMSSEINKFFLALPDEKEIPYLLVQFEDLAIRSGLLFESVDFGQQEGKRKIAVGLAKEQNEVQSSLQAQSFNSIPVSISVSGSYQAFKDYLKGLEKSARMMNVSSINFAQSDAGSGLASEMFRYNLLVNVYYGN